jgi:hypothetical protein
VVSPAFTVAAVEENPRLRFWHWWSFSAGDSGQVQVSVWDTGSGQWGQWEAVGSSITGTSSADWTRKDVDLTDYAGKRVRIAFYHTANGDSSVSTGWYLDDIEIVVYTPGRVTKGFSLVAIPADVSRQPDLRDWLPVLGDSTEIEMVMAYDAQAGTFVTLVPGDPSNESFLLKGGEGLIIYAKVEKSLDFSTLACTPPTLKAGFNLVGIACPPEGYTAFMFLDDLGIDNASSIQRYSDEKGAFETAGFGPDGRPVGVDFPIVPEEGYFLFMKQ